MTLNRREQQELAEIARALRDDDPRLARELDGWCHPRRRPRASTGVLMMLAIAFGLVVAALGAHLHATGTVVFGIVFATAMPIVLSIWLPRRR
jgi:hypothetical protein